MLDEAGVAAQEFEGVKIQAYHKPFRRWDRTPAPLGKRGGSGPNTTGGSPRHAPFPPYTWWPAQLRVQPRVATESDRGRYLFWVSQGLLSRMDKLKKRIMSQRRARYEA